MCYGRVSFKLFLQTFLSISGMQGRCQLRARLSSCRRCEDLVSCVEDLRIKAIDWTKAQELFHNSSGSSGMCLRFGVDHVEA